jgi:hypothetical protein
MLEVPGGEIDITFRAAAGQEPEWLEQTKNTRPTENRNKSIVET